MDMAALYIGDIRDSVRLFFRLQQTNWSLHILKDFFRASLKFDYMKLLKAGLVAKFHVSRGGVYINVAEITKNSLFCACV
jgi:hypothetical protein